LIRDAFGSRLYIGDKVIHVYCVRSAAEIVKMYVVGFTPKRVRLSRTRDGKGTCCNSNKTYRISQHGDST